MLPLGLGNYLAENDLVFGVTIALLILSTLALFVRIFVRIVVSRQFGKDDCLVTAAQGFFVSTCAISLVLCASPSDSPYTKLKQLIRAHNVLYSLAILAAKLSLAVFFRGVYNDSRSHVTQVYLVIYSVALSTVVGVIYLGMSIFSCAVSVSSLLADGCDAYEAYTGTSIAWAALNSCSNVILCLVSIFALIRSRLPTPVKVLTSVLILLGTIGTLSSVMRLISQITAQSESLQGVTLARWTNLEAGLCVTIASLVGVRPLFQRAVVRNSRLSGWNWDTKDGGPGFSITSISSAGPSRSGSLFSRGKGFGRVHIKTRNKSFSLAGGDRSIRSNRSRRVSGDPFFEHADRRGSHGVSQVINDLEPVRMPSMIADPGGLLSGDRDGIGGDEWSKFGEVVVTMQVDVSEEKTRTKSVCFGPDVEGGAGSGGGLLAPPRRPPFVRTRSAK